MDKIFFSVLLVAISCLVICQNQTSPIKIINHDAVFCINKTGVTRNTIFKIGFGVKIADRTESTKCFIKCLGEKLGWLSENGDVRRKVFSDYVKKFVLDIDKADLISKTCIDAEKGTGPCDFAFNINECFVQTYKNSSVNNIEYKFGLPVDIVENP